MTNVSGAEMPNRKRFQESAETPILYHEAPEHITVAELGTVPVEVLPNE